MKKPDHMPWLMSQFRSLKYTSTWDVQNVNNTIIHSAQTFSVQHTTLLFTIFMSQHLNVELVVEYIYTYKCWYISNCRGFRINRLDYLTKISIYLYTYINRVKRSNRLVVTRIYKLYAYCYFEIINMLAFPQKTGM